MRKRRFPNNGFVDSWGQLTELGRKELMGFLQCYSQPLRYLSSRYPKIARSIREYIKEGKMELEDYHCEVMQWAASSIRWYHPDKGAAVNTYLVWAIRRAAIQCLRNCKSKESSYEGYCEGEFVNLYATIPEEEQEERPDISEDMRFLSQREQTVVTELCFNNRTQRQVSQMIGVSRNRVSQIYITAIDKLKTRNGVPVIKRSRKRKPVDPSKLCVHCHNYTIVRPRGLCNRCHRDTSIRFSYPPIVDTRPNIFRQLAEK